MKTNLVTGGCGFVGKNMVWRLLETTDEQIIIIDNLSVGQHPDSWIGIEKSIDKNGIAVYSKNGIPRVFFIKEDARETFRSLRLDENYFRSIFSLDYKNLNDVFHFAAIVGGRAKIDGDPMMVALDLAIDAEFFYWICNSKPNRVLYPSSSAAYPVDLQKDDDAIALKESDIDFSRMGEPDMTYGWSKLTGEYLAKIAANFYGVHITCIRPFSGYGEDQDLSYPTPAIARRAALKEDPFEVWGSGNQGRDFIHIEDVIDCILVAMDKIGDGTAINIGMGKLTSFRDIISIFCKFAGYKPTIKPLLDKPVGVHSRYCNMDFVKKNLNWEAKISLEEGLKRVYDRAVAEIDKENA
jgi:nucleoside-diphosphate-sugar epimerase